MAATFDDRAFYSSEYATLQTAIDAMSAGDRLIIDADVTVSTTISVNNKDDIVIEGTRGTTLTADSSFNSDLLSIQDSDRVTIRDLGLNGNSSAQGAGPYTGITFESGSGCAQCVLENIYITDVQGDGLRYDNTTDLECRNVQCISNQGYGFTHEGTYAARATRPKFFGCMARANGIDAVLNRRDGWYASPLPEAGDFSHSKAISNAGNGMTFDFSGAAETIDGLTLSDMDVTGNGTSAGYGLVISIQYGTDILNNLVISGGKYNDNDLNGITVLDSSGTNTSYVQTWSINGVTCMNNGSNGVYLGGILRYGSMMGGALNVNTGSGLVLIGDSVGGFYSEYNNFVGINATANNAYGISMSTYTRYNTILGCTATGNATEEYREQGSNTFLCGGKTGSAMPSAPYDDTDETGYWIESSMLFVTGAADGTASASAASSRVTATTKLLALTPLDASAGAAMTSGLGWYYGGAEAGSHVIIRMRDVGAANYRGIFSLMLMEPLEI
jgi:hypothetical protein